jgi:PAS domain S-box-containing protein
MTTPDLSAAILDTVGEAVIAIDADQQIRLINRETERIFGYTRDELVGRSVQTIMPERFRVRHDSAFKRRLDDGRAMDVRNVEVAGMRKDGTEFPLEIRFTRCVLDGDTVFIAAAEDITERVQARQEIERLNKELARERDYLREEVKEAFAHGDIIGTSPALLRSLEQVQAVAATDANVLVMGESGVGKELFARAIHDASQRADKPLVRVNCASVPKELFESEFFGHVRGAFTGAIKDRVGRFQLAEGGTLFLDEVGEIPLDLQSKLLRVLQEREFERLGEDRTRTVDVRVVAATNRDLVGEAAAGRFREDLYYRLGVFPIQVPPLRERVDDIVLLAEHFLRRSAQKLKKPVPFLSDAVATQLRAYTWPGNIRELQNVLERATILSRAGELDLSGALVPSAPISPRPAAPAVEPPKIITAEVIEAALAEHAGNVSRAAKSLGLSRQALYRRIDKLGLQTKTRR